MPGLNLSPARVRTVSTTVVAIIVTIAVGVWVTTTPMLGIGKDNRQTVDDHSDHADHEGDAHQGHDHGHEGHSDAQSIELSKQARANLRLRTSPIEVKPYTQYIEVPGVVTQWPGRTHIAVTSPLTGVLNSILVSRGELVQSGAPLFTLRLTHQDLVNTQETFLTKLGELDVEQREIDRLSSIATSGAIAGKTLLARQYERDKLMAGVRAARQAMLLHGLTENQIKEIERTRVLIREITVYAPLIHEDDSLHHESLGDANDRLSESSPHRYASLLQPPAVTEDHRHVDAEFLVTELLARRGESVAAGDELAQLSDFSKVLIEGQAFQRDGKALRDAADHGANVQAVIESSGEGPELIDGLKVIYIGTEVDRRSRALPFYVSLTNKVERTEQHGEKRYISWRYKPGQRLTVRLPVSQIDDAIVVPKDAVAEEGAERYLFVENGDHFDRVPVSVLARDSLHVAVANDGQVWPGQTIVVGGAHQLQMAMKNRSGGAIDPHAGHNH
ncbi:HlyD family secretion protein [Stieleria maiorica]|uniref:HlyD family secretion protein n=1 Tax=Stieleria maiorica TaxID=2795974 RepID=A0A5B9MD91_9BACT|nr:efflux RND transporter periplasmic adaptor subunit [Stieleria maiorica]QEF99241.1 HlyD family secretion protein [Stieleria maiorica]